MNTRVTAHAAAQNAARVTKNEILLNAISLDLVQQLERYQGLAKRAQFVDYHGSRKWQLPRLLVELAAERANADPKTIQAELVHINSDFPEGLHRHKLAHAYCRVLGDRHQSCYDPIDATFTLGRIYEPATVGRGISIPPGTPHGFRAVRLYFISVQTPPIVGDGADDYEVLK